MSETGPRYGCSSVFEGIANWSKVRQAGGSKFYVRSGASHPCPVFLPEEVITTCIRRLSLNPQSRLRMLYPQYGVITTDGHRPRDGALCGGREDRRHLRIGGECFGCGLHVVCWEVTKCQASARCERGKPSARLISKIGWGAPSVAR